MTVEIVPFGECDVLLDWLKLVRALEDGHRLPRAKIEDAFLYRDSDTVLSRCAWIDGLGIVTKTATIFPDNTSLGKPVVNGGVSLYSDRDGVLEAVIDFHLVTKWKTAGDSLLAATKLARRDATNILIVGAGTVARSLWQAYGALFPDARFTVWSRTSKSAEALAADCPGVNVTGDLQAGVRGADIVTCATMTNDALIHGDWLRPGQHIDLIGAYRPDMREADDDVLQRARIFVDSRETTLACIGELKTPLESGAISEKSIIADYYDLASGDFCRTSDDEITLFKNGGGAHLDLMTSRYILQAWSGR
jgi:ornithine cyclodeaminase